MKGRNLILMAVGTLAVGILMILFRNTLASNNVVIGCGILFILAGLANVTIFLGSRDKHGRARMGAVGTAIGWVASAAAVVLGVVMVLFRTVFETMVGYMFAVLLLFGAIFQFCLLLFGSRPVRLSSWFFLVPMALCGAAVYIFMQQPGQADYTIMLVTGCALAFFGLMTLVEAAAISSGNRVLRKQAQTPAPAPAPTPVPAPEPEAAKTEETAEQTRQSN